MAFCSSSLAPSTSSVSLRGKYHSVPFRGSFAKVAATLWMGETSPSRHGRGSPEGPPCPT